MVRGRASKHEHNFESLIMCWESFEIWQSYNSCRCKRGEMDGRDRGIKKREKERSRCEEERES